MPPTKPTAFFITGTDTGVGKTHVSVSLVKALVKRGLRVSVMKPIASGSDRTPEGLRNADAIALAAASNVDTPYATLNPYCFEPPVSPHIAAKEAGSAIKLDVIKGNYARLKRDAEVTVVEGAGGWYAPISDSQSMADLPKALGIPAVLVVGVRLGCLNHARLSKEAIEAGGVEFAGWVANMIDPTLERPAENLASLQRLLGSEPLALFPFEDAEQSQETGGHPGASQSASARTAPASITPGATALAAPPATSQARPRIPVPAAEQLNVRCGEHLAHSLSLISFCLE